MITPEQKIFEGLLQAELAQLLGELRSVGQVNPANPADWEAIQNTQDAPDEREADATEVADKIESYEGNTAILKQLEIRLNEVKGALERMEAGTYGICSVCGKPIERARLEANPAATTCLAHKES